MAFADWLLPLLLLGPEEEHGRVPFDWASLDAGPELPRPALHKGCHRRFDRGAHGPYRWSHPVLLTGHGNP